MDAEIWRPIRGWDKYQVSNMGRVKSFKHRNEHILYSKPHPNKGYRKVTLSRWNKVKHITISRLVAGAFIGKPPFGKAVVDHINRNRSDDRVENLRYLSNKENVLLGVGAAAKNNAKTHCVNGHEFSEDNLCRYALPLRVCRTCRSVNNKKYKAQFRQMKEGGK